MIKRHFISSVKLFAMSLIFVFSCNVPAQNKTPIEIPQKVWDSLSAYPQLTMQCDLYYKLIIERYPNMQLAYMNRSIAYTKTGQHAMGFELINKAVELAPIEYLGYRTFVKLYMMHDYEGALQDCLRLDSISAYAKPGVWGEDMDMVIGLCYLQLNNFAKAQLRFTNSIKTITKENGKDWIPSRALLYLGITMLKLKEYPKAIEAFNELIQLNPNYAEAYYYKAQCYSSQNDIKNAIVTLEKCKQVFEKYRSEKNAYFEMPYQIYSSMLSDLSMQLKK